MKKQYEIAVFDVDGTLLDTTEGVLSSVRYTIKVHDLPEIPETEIKKFIGPPIQDSFQRVYGVSGDKLQELATTFRNRYKAADLLKALPYEGIYDVCAALMNQGIKIAVATYKRQDYAESIMNHFSFDRYSSIICGADHENRLKKVDIIRNCMDSMGVKDYSQAVMIGDSSHDAIGAEQIGMDFLGVTYGFDFKTREDVFKWKAIGSADTPKEILTYFR